jgi:hypothetical protein
MDEAKRRRQTRALVASLIDQLAAKWSLPAEVDPDRDRRRRLSQMTFDFGDSHDEDGTEAESESALAGDWHQ